MKKTTIALQTPKPSEQLADIEAHPELFRQVLEQSGVAMAIRNAELQPIYANQAFMDFCGYSLKEMHETDMNTVLPEETQDLYKKKIRPAVMAGVSWEGEYVVRTKTGRLHSVWSRFDPVFNASGTLTHVISVMRDASASKRLRNALAQTERHLKFLTENTSDCLFRLRLDDGKYDYISPAVESITGYSPQDFYEKPRLFEELAPTEWKKTFNIWWKEFLDGHSRYEYESPLIHKDGSRKWINQRISVVKHKDGKPIAIEGIFTDITDRRSVQEDLAIAEKSLNFISNSTSDIFFRMTIPEGTYDYLSPSVERFSGYSVQEYEDNPLLISRICHPDWADYFQETWGELCQGIVRPEYEFQYVHKNGAVRWASQRVALQKDAKGNPVAMEGIATDITERKQTEGALRESENRFRILFEDSPISLWEEDLTRLKAYFDELKGNGVTDFRKHFYEHPEDLGKCASLVDVVAVNKATLDLLKAKSQEDLLGNLDKVLTESSMAAFTEEMILLASGGCEYCGEITHRTLDGDIIWVVVHFIVPPEFQDSLSRVIVSLLDVTPRKRAEEALSESEERYRVLVENAQEGVVVSKQGKAVFINEAMTDILGYTAEELRQIHPLELVHPDDKEWTMKQLAGLVSGKQQEGFASFRIFTRDKRLKWMTLTVKPIIWNGEDAQLEILTDVTVHKSLEDELRKAHAEMEERVARRTTELSEANLLLTEEAEEREKAQEHILSLTRQLMRIQEDERQRIARDLHDNVAQDLSSISLRMETLFDGETEVGPEIRERGENINSILRGTIGSVRDIAYGLIPPALEQLGLSRALENLCGDAARRGGIDVDFFATGIEYAKLDFDIGINIYRLVQEALNNTIKHSGATNAKVRLVKSHPDLLLRIEDNGQGFAVSHRMTEAADERRMGLRSMEERARLTGGSMEIQSLIGTGTRIIVKIPITKPGEANA